MVELRTPKVWSLALELVSRVVIRRIDVMQTLGTINYRSSSHRGRATYKNPRQKTIISPHFSRDGRFKLLIIGNGKRKIPKVCTFGVSMPLYG